MKDKLLIFDGDFLLYSATMGIKCLDENNEPIKVDGKFTYIPRTEKEVLACADSILLDIFTKTNTTKYIGYLGGQKSFRYDIYPEYKGNRKDLVKPNHINALKVHLRVNWKFIFCSNGLEADDAVNVARNLYKEDYDCIIVTNDKDILKSIEGTYYEPRKQQIITTDKEEAERFFWQQMICGDVIDNIKGIPSKGIKFVEKIFQLADDCKTSYAMEVLNQYIKYFGEKKGIEEYYKNYECLKMLDESNGFEIPDINDYSFLENLELEGDLECLKM